MSYIHARFVHAIATSFANGQEREAFISIVYLILPMAAVTDARELTGAGQGIYKGIHGKKNLLAEIKDRQIPVPDDGVPFQRMDMTRLVNILVDDDSAAADDDYWSSDSAPQGGSSCASESDSDFESGMASRIQEHKKEKVQSAILP